MMGFLLCLEHFLHDCMVCYCSPRCACVFVLAVVRIGLAVVFGGPL